jgi:saccharopine dehydrogenase-like NADP-dependent oxidoreductase
MKKLAILGMGHIGKYVYDTLSSDFNFAVSGYDLSLGHDLSDSKTLRDIISTVDGVLCSTPFYLNVQIAELCNQSGVDYFDLTESVTVTDYVKTLTNAKFVTQCGLAPGMVSIIANSLANKFDRVNSIQIRVGALPTHSNNSLKYYRTWNTEGLINEYINPCPALVNGVLVNLDPLDGLEKVEIHGVELEAANTSGGIGSLPESWQLRAHNVNYKTLRYPGHWDNIKFLRDDLGLAENFDTYVKLFNDCIPTTTDDVVYIYINVTGQNVGQSTSSVRQYVQKISCNENATAIQRSTAAGVMAVLETWATDHMNHLSGWVRQEDLNGDVVLSSKYTTSIYGKI